MSRVPDRAIQDALLPEISSLPRPDNRRLYWGYGVPKKRKVRYEEPVLLEELARYLNHPYQELKRWAESWNALRSTTIVNNPVRWVTVETAARLILIARIAQGAVWEYWSWDELQAKRARHAEYCARWKREKGKVKSAEVKKRKDHVPL